MSDRHKDYIGIDDRRLLHVREVGRVCAELADSLFGWPESKSREMFILGFIHDVGYEYSSDQQQHEEIGGTILKPMGFKYAQEVYCHGNPEVTEMTHELLILNIADMSVNGSGQRVSFDQRLQDIENRYGVESSQYQNAVALTSKIESELERLGKTIPDLQLR
ncbi:HD domain-containing protein [Corynebacterium casei]|uniref:HD domain-containing protein n=1 Tax=Corynebacterium casei TaxID=160386 RepID=UPI0026474227|nr:HD domain-containing protein [Corynebacterium casei]MDN5903574.1 HD domain-containing protein [Corynebacterium casei]